MVASHGSNVYAVKDFRIGGSRFTMRLNPASGNRPALTRELDAAGKHRLTGMQQRGEAATVLTGVCAPELKRADPKRWSVPEPLFSGNNLPGWEPVGNPANSRWTVKDGLLVNEEKGGNLKTTRTSDDFRLHSEVSCPERTNTVMYLRGRYASGASGFVVLGRAPLFPVSDALAAVLAVNCPPRKSRTRLTAPATNAASITKERASQCR